jgi:hypothetical protein
MTMWRTRWASLGILGMVVGLSLTGCDSVVGIRGEITSTDGGALDDCTATLFRAKNGDKLQQMDIEPVFDDGFVTGSVRTDFFVDVRCDGYATFRSPPFYSSGVLGDPPAELGEIRLEPATAVED